MKKVLRAQENPLHHFVNGEKVWGCHERLFNYLRELQGNVTYIFGDARGIFGDASGIFGDVTDISGNLTGIFGSVTGVFGDLDECDISEGERAAGVDIKDLIRE